MSSCFRHRNIIFPVFGQYWFFSYFRCSTAFKSSFWASLLSSLIRWVLAFLRYSNHPQSGNIWIPNIWILVRMGVQYSSGKVTWLADHLNTRHFGPKIGFFSPVFRPLLMMSKRKGKVVRWQVKTNTYLLTKLDSLKFCFWIVEPLGIRSRLWMVT